MADDDDLPAWKKQLSQGLKRIIDKYVPYDYLPTEETQRQYEQELDMLEDDVSQHLKHIQEEDRRRLDPSSPDFHRQATVMGIEQSKEQSLIEDSIAMGRDHLHNTLGFTRDDPNDRER